jgi:hypothetical protein
MTCPLGRASCASTRSESDCKASTTIGPPPTRWLNKSIAAFDASKPQVKQAIVMAVLVVLAGLVSRREPPADDLRQRKQTVGCLNAIAGPQAIQVMLTALFACAVHASLKASA